MKTVSLACLSLLFSGLGATVARAEITLAGGRAVLTLSEEAVPRSLVLAADGVECLDRTKPEPFAEALLSDGAWHAARSASKRGDTLTLGFRDTDTTLSLAVEERPDWIALRVAGVGGARPQAVRFAMLDAAFTETVGKRLNIGWNRAHALCVMATSPLAETQVAGPTQVTLADTVDAVARGEGGVLPRVRLTAVARGAALEGASAAIIACPTPDFEAVARGVARAYGLPANETAGGVPVKDTDWVRGSYLFTGAGLSDADRLIRLCNDAGLRAVLLDAAAWCASDGALRVNVQNFPKGVEDLAAFVGRLKAAGITAGLHSVAPKAGAEAGAGERLADLYNACGFGMVYFEGDPGGTFQAAALRRLSRPVLCAGSSLSQRLWHAYARGGAVDTYLDTVGGTAGEWPTVRRHVDASVASLLGLRNDRMPGELGWFGVWPRQTLGGRAVEGLQLDELEYLLCRSVAFDCPVSLRTTFGELEKNPLSPDILRLVKLYEAARLSRTFSEATQAPLREPGRDFTLLQRAGFGPVLVPVRPVPVGGSRDVRAMVGAFETGSVATFWSAAGSARVTLDLSPLVARVADLDDQRVVAQKSADGKLILPVAARRLTLLCPTVKAAELEQKIRAALPAK